MRLNKFIASVSGLSRRAADQAIIDGRVRVNEKLASVGQSTEIDDIITLDGVVLQLTNAKSQTILLNKPVGYICSRNGQGGKTIYELLPKPLHKLKPVGRLDKDSSGLLLLTNDGDLHFSLTHPSQEKTKIYHVSLDKPLLDADKQLIGKGVSLDDGKSKLMLQQDKGPTSWVVTMHEGRNRQIRRTFAALGYDVAKLHRTQFGPYVLDELKSGDHKEI